MNLSKAGKKLRDGDSNAAKDLGRVGGKSRSKEKVRAARKNGMKHTGN